MESAAAFKHSQFNDRLGTPLDSSDAHDARTIQNEQEPFEA